MNLLLLLAALVPWAASPISAFTRIFAAISLLSVEMQLVTLLGVGTLQTLPLANVAVALLLIGWQSRRSRPFATAAWGATLRGGAPVTAVALLAAVVLFLNICLPLQAADPYHLERVAQIERLGTVAHDPAANPKVNILGWLYELVLADLRQIPLVGAGLMKVHGLFDLLLYAVAIAAACTLLLPGASLWPLTALLLVPPVFHELVLIKNDLFVAAPALVTLVWLVAGASRVSWKDDVWAGWLVGLVVGYKLTMLPLAITMAGGVLLVARRRHEWASVGGLLLGGSLGVICSGLLLTSWENTRFYDNAFASRPVAEIGNVNATLADAAESVTRFGISLLDLGLLTPRWWPGRGGWGGTFGLPFVWAAIVVTFSWRQAREARWALAIAAVHFVAFSATFPDADLAHRLALAPALLVIVVAVHLLQRTGTLAAAARKALVPVLALATAQILRSVMLYLVGG